MPACSHFSKRKQNLNIAEPKRDTHKWRTEPAFLTRAA